MVTYWIYQTPFLLDEFQPVSEEDETNKRPDEPDPGQLTLETEL
jgi:hypothetical protein